MKDVTINLRVKIPDHWSFAELVEVIKDTVDDHDDCEVLQAVQMHRTEVEPPHEFNPNPDSRAAREMFGRNDAMREAVGGELPLLVAKEVYDCCECGDAILPDDEYRDGGQGNRLHDSCAQQVQLQGG